MSEADFLREPPADAYEERLLTVIQRGIQHAKEQNVRVTEIQLHPSRSTELMVELRERASTFDYYAPNGRIKIDGIPVTLSEHCPEDGVLFLHR